jgi:hypothetical protein
MSPWQSLKEFQVHLILIYVTPRKNKLSEHVTFTTWQYLAILGTTASALGALFDPFANFGPSLPRFAKICQAAVKRILDIICCR